MSRNASRPASGLGSPLGRGETAWAVARFGWDSHLLAWELFNGVDGIAGPLALTISPDGAHLYAASGDQSAVTVFARDKATGRLTLRVSSQMHTAQRDTVALCLGLAVHLRRRAPDCRCHVPHSGA